MALACRGGRLPGAGQAPRRPRRHRRGQRPAGRWSRPTTTTGRSASTSGSTSTSGDAPGSPGCWPTKWSTPSWWATPSSAREHDGWGLEVVVHPDHRGGLENLAAALLAAAVARGGPAWWRPPPLLGADARPTSTAPGRRPRLRPDAELRQLRVALPLPPTAVTAGTPAIDVRPFVVGVDEAGLADGQQPGLRRPSRAGRLGPGHPARRARPSPGSIRPASCSTRRAGGWPARAGPRSTDRPRRRPRMRARSS